MSFLGHLVGTFLMFAGFVLILAGLLLSRITQQDLGRTYMSSTFMGGGQMPSGAFFRFVASVHGNDALKRRKALRLLLAGLAVSVLGALLG